MNTTVLSVTNSQPVAGAEMCSRDAVFLSHLSEVIAIDFSIISQDLMVNVLLTKSRGVLVVFHNTSFNLKLYTQLT